MAVETQQPTKPTFKTTTYKSDVHSEWCPGCGDFGIVAGIQQALAELQLPPWETYLFSGVGCSGKAPHYIHVYGAHTLHGRVLPFSLGAKIANPELTVLAVGGDGDGYGIGAGHFVHAGRRNVDMTYLVFDNEVYGLTKGQASPTLAQDAQPKSLPAPNIFGAINPLALALVCGYTFIARSYAFDSKHLKATIQAAVQHRGMALIDVLQPCPTYNDLHTKEFYSGTVEVEGKTLPRVYYLDQAGYDGKVKNPQDTDEILAKQAQAYAKATAIEEQIALGVFYQVELPTYHDRVKHHLPLLQEYTPLQVPYYKEDGTPTTDLTSAMADYCV
jgi:2-oxoglutarate ferredoxin oxidoreductase subunit beta